MKIAIVSSFFTGNEAGISGHEAGLEYSYARAFRELGHAIEEVRDTPKEVFRLPRRLSRISEWTNTRLYEAPLCKHVLDLNVELVLVIKGRGVTAEVVRRWRSAGLRVVNLMPDNPFEAASVGLGASGLLSQYRAVDLVLVHDRIAVGQLRECGIRSEFIAFARDPMLHHFDDSRGQSRAEFNVVFVGNPDPDRIRYLRNISDLGLAVFGSSDWLRLGNDDPLRNCVRGGPQHGSAMVATLRKSLMSVNIFRRSQKSAHNMRTFEGPSCGVCCISEYTIGVAEFMRQGQDTEMFRSPKELREVVTRLLATPERIAEIAASGYERVANETYNKRAEQLLQILG